MKPVSLLKLALNLDQSALTNLIFAHATEGAGISEQGSVLCGASVSDANGYFAVRDPILISKRLCGEKMYNTLIKRGGVLDR
jgi:hypothetical protein